MTKTTAERRLGLLVQHTYSLVVPLFTVLERWRLAGWHARATAILSNSSSTLQAVQDPKTKSAQWIIFAILKSAENAKSHGIGICLQWILGHCEVPSNTPQINWPGKQPRREKPTPSLSHEKAFIRRGVCAQWEKEWKESRTDSPQAHEAALHTAAEKSNLSANTSADRTLLVSHLCKSVPLSRRRPVRLRRTRDRHSRSLEFSGFEKSATGANYERMWATLSVMCQPC